MSHHRHHFHHHHHHVLLLQLIALFDEFPMTAMTSGVNGGGLALYSKIGHSLNSSNMMNNAHYHQQSSAMNGIYGEVNQAPTHPHQRLPSNSAASEASSKAAGGAAAASITVNRVSGRIESTPTTPSPGMSTNNSSNSSIRHNQSMSNNHYGPLRNGQSLPRPEGIYGIRTSTEQYQYAFQQQQHQQRLALQQANATLTNHQRNGSVTDSLLSSNESPDLLTEHVHHSPNDRHNQHNNQPHHHLHNRSDSYTSAHMMHNSSLQSAAPANRSFSTQPLAIAGRRSVGNARDLSLSRSYDAKYALLRRHDDHHLLTDYEMDEGNSSGHVVEITEENISLYASTTANARSGDMVAPVLHVRRGSDPSATNASDNSCRRPLIISNGNGHLVNGHYQHHQHNAHHLNDLSNEQQSVKRWSTAAATTTSTLSSRLFPPKSSMVSCYLHPLLLFVIVTTLYFDYHYGETRTKAPVDYACN